MSNRIATAFLVAVLGATIGGCDIGAADRKTQPPAVKEALAEARYQVDPARNRVWFLNHEGVFMFELSKAGRVALALPEWVWAHEPYGCLPDLALGPRGEVVITSNVLPTLWRIDPDTLAVSVHRPALDADGDKDVDFSALVYSREHGAFLAASYGHGSLWRIDPKLVTAQKVTLSTPVREACGLAVRQGNLRAKTGKPAGLCLRTLRDEWTIDFSPDGRSAYVGSGSCPDRPL